MGIATAIIELVGACVELGFKAAGGLLDLAASASAVFEHLPH